MKKTTLIPAAGYIRMSSDQQENSPDRQKVEIEKLAKREGCTIVVWYEDLGMTGTESAKRKGFQKLLTDAKAGKFKAVLMYEQSRMSREDPLDALDHLRKLRDAGVMLYTCQRGKIDTTNIAGLLLAVVESHGAHDESRKISERVTSGKIKRVKDGHRQGGCVLGYDRVFKDETGKVAKRVVGAEKFRKPGTWTVRLEPSSDPKQIEAVKFLFKSAAKGMPITRIAREANQAGLVTVMGRKWSTTTVRQVLVNPTYAGDVHFGRKNRGKFNSTIGQIGEVLIIRDQHPAIVSPDVFLKASAHAKQKHRTAPPRKLGRYLLSGICWCASMNAPLYGMTTDTNPARYHLHASFHTSNPGHERQHGYRVEIIDRGVVNAVIRAFDSKALEEVRKAITKQTMKEATAEARIEGQLAEVRAKIERAVDNITIAASADVPGMSRRLGEFREQEKVLVEQLNAIRGEVLPTPESVGLISKLWKLLPTLGKAKSPEHRELLANALRKTIKRVTLRTHTFDGPDKMPVVKTWSGIIEFHPGFHRPPVELTDDDIPSPFAFRRALEVLRKAGRPMLMGEIARTLYGASYGTTEHNNVSIWLRCCAAIGRVEKLGHHKGWVFRR